MRTFVRMFWVLAGFFAVATVVYIVWTWAYEAQRLATDPTAGQGPPYIEWAGTISLGLCSALAILIAFYLGRVSKSPAGSNLPEDREDADIDDGGAEQGHFSPWSWWPITLAAACALVVLGIAIGFWISVIGVGVLAVALVGWVYEYYRRYFAR